MNTRLHYFGILCIVVVGLAAYSNSFSGPFFFDDEPAISGNPYIRHLWPLSDAMTWPRATTVAGRPVVCLSLAVNYAVSGLDVWSYHAFNVLVHILNALLLYGIIRRTLEARVKHSTSNTPTLQHSNASIFATAVALLWVAHPLQTEAVTYIVQRTELLFAFFLLLTLYCLIRGHDSEKRGVWWTAGVASCAMGMGCKEVMVVAPVVAWLYDRTFLAGSFRETFRARWKFYAGLAATWMIVAGLVFTSPRSGSAGFGLAVTPWQYAVTQGGVILHYLRLAFWPHPLVVDYSDWRIAQNVAEWGMSVAIVAALLLASLWALKQKTVLGFLGCVFFLILAPTSSFVPIATEPAAERRMYLPLAVLAVLFVFAVDWISRRTSHAVSWLLLVATVIGLGAATWSRNQTYRSELDIWQDVVSKRPNNPSAHNNLGVVLKDDNRDDEAEFHFREALRFNPRHANAFNNLGLLFHKRGQMREAAAYFSRALDIEPLNASAHNNLGSALSELGNWGQAEAHYRAALEINPLMSDVHNNLALALVQRDKVGEAVKHFEAALQLAPRPEAHFNLARVAEARRRFGEAVTHYTKAAALFAAQKKYAAAIESADGGIAAAKKINDRAAAEQLREQKRYYQQNLPPPPAAPKKP